MIEIWDTGKRLWYWVDKNTGINYNEEHKETAIILLDSGSFLAYKTPTVDLFWRLVGQNRGTLLAWADLQFKYDKSDYYIDLRRIKQEGIMIRLTDTEIVEYYIQGARFDPFIGNVVLHGHNLRLTPNTVARFREYQYTASAMSDKKKPQLTLIKGGRA